MTYVLTAPRGFFDPTRPGLVERVFPDQQSFNAYVSVLQQQGLQVDFSAPDRATYVRSEALAQHYARRAA